MSVSSPSKPLTRTAAFTTSFINTSLDLATCFFLVMHPLATSSPHPSSSPLLNARPNSTSVARGRAIASRTQTFQRLKQHAHLARRGLNRPSVHTTRTRRLGGRTVVFPALDHKSQTESNRVAPQTQRRRPTTTPSRHNFDNEEYRPEATSGTLLPPRAVLDTWRT